MADGIEQMVLGEITYQEDLTASSGLPAQWPTLEVARLKPRVQGELRGSGTLVFNWKRRLHTQKPARPGWSVS